jgi:hypothetical protein
VVEFLRLYPVEKKWFNAGCDFFGYAWGTPPDFRPHPDYAAAVDAVRKAYQEMP